MTEEQYLLTCVAEECNEVAQRCSKAIRFSMEEVQEGQLLSNKDRILQEFNDLYSVMFILFQDELLNQEQIHEKAMKIGKYMKYSQHLGILKL